MKHGKKELIIYEIKAKILKFYGENLITSVDYA